MYHQTSVAEQALYTLYACSCHPHITTFHLHSAKFNMFSTFMYTHWHSCLGVVISILINLCMWSGRAPGIIKELAPLCSRVSRDNVHIKVGWNSIRATTGTYLHKHCWRNTSIPLSLFTQEELKVAVPQETQLLSKNTATNTNKDSLWNFVNMQRQVKLATRTLHKIL